MPRNIVTYQQRRHLGAASPFNESFCLVPIQRIGGGSQWGGTLLNDPRTTQKLVAEVHNHKERPRDNYGALSGVRSAFAPVQMTEGGGSSLRLSITDVSLLLPVGRWGEAELFAAVCAW